MKTPGAVLLLLWTGLVVVAEVGKDLQNKTAATASTQQTCQPDIYTELREMRALMAELIDSNTVMNNALNKLRSISEDSKVAFSASFSVLSDKHIGPFHTETALVFNHVFINIGSGYHPNTGIFTAPVRGVYKFSYHVFAGGAHGAGANLRKNGHHVVVAYNHKAPHDINTSQGVSLLLEVGDKVGLILRKESWVAAYNAHSTTFSGQLLFLM